MMHLAVVGMVMAMAQVTLASPATSAASSLSTHSAFEEIADTEHRALQLSSEDYDRIERQANYQDPNEARFNKLIEDLKFWVPVVCLSLGVASALHDYCAKKSQGGQRQGGIYASDAISSDDPIRSDPVGTSSYVPPVVNQEQDASLLVPEVKSLAATLEEAQLSQYESALREFQTFFHHT